MLPNLDERTRALNPNVTTNASDVGDSTILDNGTDTLNGQEPTEPNKITRGNVLGDNLVNNLHDHFLSRWFTQASSHTMIVLLFFMIDIGNFMLPTVTVCTRDRRGV